MRKLMLFCLGLISALLVAESILRLTESYVVRDRMSAGSVIENDPEFLVRNTTSGRRLVPNVRVTIKNHYLSKRDIPVSTNSLGFRDEEIGEKVQSEFRILVLGDSITLGDYLKADEVYVEKIGKYLESNFSGKKLQVVNAGVSDIGLAEEVDILEEKGLAIKPDMIVVGFYLNDSRPPHGFPIDIDYRNFWRRQSVLIETIYRELVFRKWVKENNVNYRDWSRIGNKNWRQDPGQFKEMIQATQYDWGAAWTKESWISVEKQLERLVLLSKKHNFKVVIVCFPVSYQVYADYSENYPQTMLKNIADKLKLEYIDLLPVLRDFRQHKLYYDHAHPTVFANDLIGKEIAEEIKNKL